MRRREFISLIGGAAAWPLAARAQSAMPVVTFIRDGSADASTRFVVAFRKGLNETGYVEGKNVAVEYYWLEGQHDRLPALLADLIQRQVAVIATAATPMTLAAKATSTTVPIVFMMDADPVKVGVVASFNRPGGNVTGVSFLANSLLARQFEVLHETVPNFDRLPCESEQSECRDRYERRASRGGCAWAETVCRSSPHRERL